MSKRLLVVVRAEDPPVADLETRAQSLAVVESHLKVLGYEIQPTLATRCAYWWRIGRHRDRTKGKQ